MHLCVRLKRQNRFFASMKSCMQACGQKIYKRDFRNWGMESLINMQKRVRFSESQHLESNNNTENSLLSQIESITAVLGDKVQNWFQRLFSDEINQDYDPQDSEYATAVAAAAFSIYSVEEAEAQYRRKMREELEMSRTKSKSRKDDAITRRPSSKDLRNGGGTSFRSLAEVDRRAQESAFPITRPSRSASVRSMTPEAMDPKQKGIPPRHRNVETKKEAWERAQMEKLIKRYEKAKAAVLAWENEKKLQARLKMEKKQGELEQRRILNQQHYQNKIARIKRISGGARAQAEEERRNKEAEIKEKAKMVRSRGKTPIKYCFCC